MRPVFSLFLFIAPILLTGCGEKSSESGVANGQGSKAPAAESINPWHDIPNATFVGAESCKACHAAEFSDWLQSDHHKAMLPATPENVLGDFNDVTFTHFEHTWRFFRKGDEFWVNAEDADGTRKDFKIDYTFGFEPLQQYLIPFPGGRYQALQVCWDTRPVEDGGQRWYHLYQDEAIPPGDILHWTGIHFNWNYMCADCHSTDLHKNYDPDARDYHTTWSEMNVSCEACHGPASEHLKWAAAEQVKAAGGTPEVDLSDLTAYLKNKGLVVTLKEPVEAGWAVNPETQQPYRTAPLNSTVQVQTCARCHSHRQLMAPAHEAGKPFLDTHVPSVLTDQLYHHDGQVDEEDYVYGSFVQSKMYHAGVVCTDCHNPHTGRLKAPGDSLCLNCHLPSRFATPDHSHHEKVSCVECHMPGKTYMVNDFRRDHSFRVPRPDVSAQTGSPNTCNQCHQDKSVKWAQEAYMDWYGEPEPHFGTAFHKLQKGDQTALSEVASIAQDKSYPDIVRAGAVSLAPLPELIPQALKDESHLVRREAVRSLTGAPLEARTQLLPPLAADPVADVRIEAGRLLADDESASAAVRKAVDEYRRSLDYSSDRVESRLGRAELFLSQGKAKEAEEEFKTALARFPRSPQAYVNAADYYRVFGQDEIGEKVLREGLAQIGPPESAVLHHSLGLLLVREKRYQEGLSQLEKAFRQSPEDARYAVVYAVGLESLGELDSAVEVLEKTLKRRPRDTQILELLKNYRAKATGE